MIGRRARQMNESNTIIHTYTRAQAIEDGFLVDVSERPEAKECGFKFPVALTWAAWVDCVQWSAEDTKSPQDEQGRLWDVLWMLRHAIKCATEDGNLLPFALYRIPREGKSTKATLVWLKSVIGPGDSAKPVITIMLPHED